MIISWTLKCRFCRGVHNVVGLSCKQLFTIVFNMNKYNDNLFVKNSLVTHHNFVDKYTMHCIAIDLFMLSLYKSGNMCAQKKDLCTTPKENLIICCTKNRKIPIENTHCFCESFPAFFISYHCRNHWSWIPHGKTCHNDP